MYFVALKEAQAELIQIYTDVTQSVDVLPFKDDSPGLPVSNIFAPLLMEEDLKSKERMPNPDNPCGKELKNLQEMFYAEDKPAKRIFMKGEAGCGKTFFCLKLLDTWCQVKQSGIVTDDVLQQCLARFDLVFYLPLRHYKEKLTSVKDMISQYLSEQCLNILVSGGRIHCLVILDGLDESPFGLSELPSMHGIVSYVLFCTTRPWKLTQLQLTYNQDDKVLQILGLLPSSKEKVIEYVLVNFYNLKKETPEFKVKSKKYLSLLKQPGLGSLVNIPMMLTACCCMWYEEDFHSKKPKEKKGKVTIDSPTEHTSITFTYLSLVDSMIRLADQKCDLRSLLTQTCPSPQINIPDVLRSFSYIHSFLDALLPLCRLAYTDLVSGETKLVFQKDELERQIGRPLVEIALKVGLISQTKAPGRFHQQNVSVNFYHKSVQEFLAAIHLTCTDTDDIRLYCTSLDKVMNVANIIMFGISLDPSFCNKVSKHVMETVNTDPGIQQYRRTLHYMINDRVEQLYLTQYEWYRELTRSRTVTGDTSPPPSLHITDIYLDHKRDSDTVSLTGELMCVNRDTIVSVRLWYVHSPLHGVAQYLPQCPNLTALYITCISNTNHAQIVSVIPRLTQLDTLRYNGRLTAEEDVAGVAAVLRLTQLRCIQLARFYLGVDDVLVLTTDWTRLRTVVLFDVRMSAGSWRGFVSSLLTVPHPVHVTLLDTNIDYDTRRRIQTSPHFTVTQDGGGRWGSEHLVFTTVPRRICCII